MTLKFKNMPLIVAFLLGQAALVMVMLGRSPAPFLQDWKDSGVAALIAIVVAYVLSDLIGDQNKARLVFWKWSNPLPGCAAFTEHMHADDRIDPASLERKHGQLPTDAAQQNRVWYSIYKPHRDKAHVQHSHGRYLLLRELTTISAVLAVTLTPAALLLSATQPTWKAAYAMFLIVQYLTIAAAAANAGVRMVKNALAEECA